MVRYQSNGILDDTFGQGGVVTTVISNRSDYGFDIAFQPDGKIIVVGSSRTFTSAYTLLVRYQPNGTLDGGFGQSGVVTTSIGRTFSGTSSSANAIVIQPDDKIVVGGEFFSNDYYTFLARYDAQGQLDSQFGKGGIVPPVTGGYISSYVNDIALEAGGRIIIVGSGNDQLNPPPDYAMYVARFTGQGNSDIFFGHNGLTRLDFPLQTPRKEYLGAGVDLQVDGKIVVAGSYRVVSDTTTSHFLVARLFGGDNPNVRDVYLPLVLKA